MIFCLYVFQPALFENIVNEAIQHLHEVVVQNKTGESEVWMSCLYLIILTYAKIKFWKASFNKQPDHLAQRE